MSTLELPLELSRSHISVHALQHAIKPVDSYSPDGIELMGEGFSSSFALAL